VETFRNRAKVEKYSHLATWQEIADKGYNVNIPRYVDTFEKGEEIDLRAVMQKIRSLEAKRAELDRKIVGYFRELGVV